jgi:hypothetical protein
MDSDINRLGFDSWASNKFVNAMEDYIVGNGGEGNISIESKDYNLNMEWNEKTITCTIRAYTSDGWQTYQKEIKRNA